MAKKQTPVARPRRAIAAPEAAAEAELPKTAAPRTGKKKVVKKVTTRRVAKKKKKKTKAQKVKEAWQPGSVEDSGGAFLDTIMDRLQKDAGDAEIATVGTDVFLLIGIPLPSFCLEYLLGITVWPLSRLVMVVGPEASMKSAFLFEITRWFKDECEGPGFTLEHESKFSEIFARSIIGWQHKRATGHIPCDSINAWQMFMQSIFKQLKLMMIGTAKNKGPGMLFPVHMTVDSIMGKSMMETQERVEKKGFADRDHPVEAKSITSFLRKIPQDIRRWPFALTCVNHLKCEKDERGFLKRNKAGGKALDFQETFEIEMSRVKRFAAKHYEALQLRMKCAKSSLGTDARNMLVDVLFWDEPVDPDDPDGDWRQKTVFDWHGATIRLLLGMKDQEIQRWKGDKAADDPGVLDLTELSRGNKGKGVWSKKLGIPKDDPVSFEEAGRMLMENEQVLTALRHRFGIKIFPEFQPGVDYRRQRGLEKRKIKEKLR